MLNPDVDKFVDALVDLCIGVQVGNYVTTMKNTHTIALFPSSLFLLSLSNNLQAFSFMTSNCHYQDYTTIFVEDEKIEGFFPRVTQLVSVVMLLVSKTSDLSGCVLEINTGNFYLFMNQ